MDNTSSSLNKAIDVLEYIHSAGGECTLTAIAHGLGMYKSGVHRALATLKARGYVTQDAASGRYGLGPRLFVLGSMVGDSFGVVKALQPGAQRLCDKYGECIHITVPYYDSSGLPQQLLVAKIRKPGGVLTVSPPVGSVTLCHASASGKCMLAFAPPHELSRYSGCELRRLTPNTITSWDVLGAQLAQIRAQGYATEDGETEAGLSCTGVPCLGADGKIWGVVSISGPTSRIRALDVDEVVADLREAANIFKGI